MPWPKPSAGSGAQLVKELRNRQVNLSRPEVEGLLTALSRAQQGLANLESHEAQEVGSAFEDIEHLLQQASARSRSKPMNELVDLSDLSNLREQALEAFRSQEKMSLNEALEQGAVTCRRRACKRRHDNTISGVLGLGFCSSQCASRENEKQQKLLDKYTDEDGMLHAEGLCELDLAWVTQYGMGMVGGMPRLRLLVFNEDIAFRLACEHCARQVEEAAGPALEGVRSFWRSEQERRNAPSAAQTTSDLQLNYQAAHKVFPAAWSIVHAAAGDVSSEGSPVVAFSFANAGQIIRRTACAATDRLSIKDYSRSLDFLRFVIIFQEEDVWQMCEVYERLIARGIITLRVSNELAPKAYFGEHFMYVRMNCKLQSPGHIFEIRLCFRCFYQLERSLRWMLDWRQLLRPQHHFLPGEENHYKGHLTDKDGQVSEVEAIPKSELQGKPHGKGQMFYADSGDMYEGQWQNGKKHGEGCQNYASGDSYQGCYQNNKKHGHGSYRYADGDFHEGEYFEGRKHGPGVYWYSDGRVLMSTYDQDEQAGPGVVWSANRSQAWLTESGMQVADLDLQTAERKVKSIGFEPPT